jgi:hypothetical protein
VPMGEQARGRDRDVGGPVGVTRPADTDVKEASPDGPPTLEPAGVAPPANATNTANCSCHYYFVPPWWVSVPPWWSTLDAHGQHPMHAVTPNPRVMANHLS